MKSTQIDQIFEKIKSEIPGYHHKSIFRSLKNCSTPLLDFLEKRVR